MFMQPLSARHNCCHHQKFAHHTTQDIYVNRSEQLSAPSTSSVCLSQCTDHFTKSSLSSSVLSMKIEDHIQLKQTQKPSEQSQHTHSNDLINLSDCCDTHAESIATNFHAATVRFIDSTTSSSEPNSLSLLFKQTTHQNDSIRFNHVIHSNAHIF